MTKDEQLAFAGDLIAGIQKTIFQTIAHKGIPENWDGHELRQWIADTFKDQGVITPMKGKRMKDYKNACIVHNL